MYGHTASIKIQPCVGNHLTSVEGSSSGVNIFPVDLWGTVIGSRSLAVVSHTPDGAGPSLPYENISKFFSDHGANEKYKYPTYHNQRLSLKKYSLPTKNDDK